MGRMAEGSLQEYLLNSRKNISEGIDTRASINAHHSESTSSSAGNNSNNNKQHSGEVASSKSSNLNRTRVAGVLWISNARLLCVVMALDLMIVSVQVCRAISVSECPLHGQSMALHTKLLLQITVVGFPTTTNRLKCGQPTSMWYRQGNCLSEA